MKKTNRITSILLAAIMVLSLTLLSGCQEGQSSSQPNGPQVPSVSSLPEPASDKISEITGLVKVKDYIPDIFVDMKYAGKDNFTGARVYNFDDAYLCLSTVRKLAVAQGELSRYGLSLVIWDAFRPAEAQQKLWDTLPDPAYVADPSAGPSKHSSGAAVDVGLVKTDGSPVELPSDFDEFSSLGDRDYSDASADAAYNACLLQNIMEMCGFDYGSSRWWMYYDSEADCCGYVAPDAPSAEESGACRPCPSQFSCPSQFYGVFIGASRDYDRALAFLEGVRNLGFDAMICVTCDWDGLNSECWYAVTAGICEDRQEAEELRIRAVDAGYVDAYVKFSGSYTGLPTTDSSIYAPSDSNSASACPSPAPSGGKKADIEGFTGGKSVVAPEDDWRKLLADYLEFTDQEDYLNGIFIYIDDDDVPELLQIGSSLASGCRLISIKNGSIYRTDLTREMFMYLERGGLFIDPWYQMGFGGDSVYRMTEEGPECIFSGSYCFDTEYSSAGKTECMLNGAPVDEAVYDKEFEAAFDLSDRRLRELHDSCVVPYSNDELIELLRSSVEPKPADMLRGVLAGNGSYIDSDGRTCRISDLFKSWPDVGFTGSFYCFEDLDGDGTEELVIDMIGSHGCPLCLCMVFTYRNGEITARDIPAALLGCSPTWYKLDRSSFGVDMEFTPGDIQMHKGFPAD